MRGLRLLLALLCLFGAAGAQQQVTIDTGDDPNSRLELRNYVLPDGTEVTFYVLRGDPLTITIGEQQLSATHVEVDLTRNELRVIGPGSFFNGSETVEGTDLIISLADETFSARDVLVITGALDVLGSAAWRVPGQISFVDGAFSPCSRCGQEVEDYGFRAERLELYPGDRLIAYRVTMLVRGQDFLYLPLMVVPLARPDRQPQLVIRQGTETERAQVALDWPYVTGPSSYGTFSIRYYADVDVDGGGLAGRILGGSVQEQYLGGGFDHVFYTDAGSGSFRLMYRPAFLNPEAPDGRELQQFNWRWHWLSDPDALNHGEPEAEVLVERDDSRRYGIVEYRTSLVRENDLLRYELLSQGFFDLVTDDLVREPSYAGRSTPRRTFFSVRFTPLSQQPITLGILRFSQLALEGGVFEDSVNPAMRAVTTRAFWQAARARVTNSVELLPLGFWSDFELEGRSSFSGWYYSSGQRLIDWSTRLTGTQRFGEYGSLSLTFARDVTEGETPFRFDQLPLRERTEVTGRLRLVPGSWLNLEMSAGYVFRDSRSPRVEGWRPLETTVTLFDDISWLGLTLKNVRDLETGDPGNADVTLTLRYNSRDLDASLEAGYTHDLDPDFSTDGAVPVNDTASRLEGDLRTENMQLEFGWGYNFVPSAPDDPADPLPYWEPFTFGLTLGSMRAKDDKAGFRVSWTRDMNFERVQAFQYEARTGLGPLELYVSERYRLPQGGVDRTTFRVTYPGYLQLEASGMSLIRPEWIWLEDDPDQVRTHTWTVSDAPDFGPQLWQVRYRTTFDPNLTTLDGSIGGRRDSALELRALLEEEPVGASRFSVDLFVDLPLADDRLPDSYLRRANLTLGLDVSGRVGLQGTLGYRGTYSLAEEEVTRGELTLTNLALTVRVLDDLYVGAMLNDVWDLTGNSTELARFNLQPEFLVMWNRCCWALYGSWNSATGRIRVALTTPGATSGLVEEITTPWKLPDRHESAGDPG